jgi:hypothetical protein
VGVHEGASGGEGGVAADLLLTVGKGEWLSHKRGNVSEDRFLTTRRRQQMTKKMCVNLVLVVALLFPLGMSVVSAVPLRQEELTYTVKLADNLWTLAEKYLGNGAVYWCIVAATNKKADEDETFATIADPNLVHPGWKLSIPSAEECEALLVAWARENAVARLIEEVIEPSSSWEWADAYGLPEPLPKDAEVWPYLSEESVSISEPTWFFWVDDEPHAMFVHPTRFVFIGAESNQLTVLQAQWWPVVNGESLWANVDERLDDPNNVYRGPFAFPDPTLYPRDEPEASNWEQPLPVLAVGGQALTRLASYTPQTVTGYAILVAGDDVRASKKTVEAFYKHLKDVEKYDAKNIEVLKPAKRASDIAEAFDRIKKKGIKAGDTLIFFYAGHGGEGFAEIGRDAGICGPKLGDGFWYDLKKDQEKYRFSIDDEKEVKEWERRLNEGRIEIDMALKLETPRDVYKDCKFSTNVTGKWVFTVGKGSKEQEFRIRKVGKRLLVFAMPKKDVNQNSLAYNLLKLPNGVNVIIILETCNAGSAIDLLEGNNIKAEVFTASDKSSSAYHTPASWHSTPICDFTEWLLKGKGTEKGNWMKGFNYAKGMIGGTSWWYYLGLGGRKNSKPQHEVISAYVSTEDVEIYVATEDGRKPLEGAEVTISGEDLTGKQHIITGVTNDRGEFVTKVSRGLAYDITASYKDKELDCGSRTIKRSILNPHPSANVFYEVRLTCTKLTKSP